MIVNFLRSLLGIDRISGPLYIRPYLYPVSGRISNSVHYLVEYPAKRMSKDDNQFYCRVGDQISSIRPDLLPYMGYFFWGGGYLDYRKVLLFTSGEWCERWGKERFPTHSESYRSQKLNFVWIRQCHLKKTPSLLLIRRIANFF